MQKVEPRREDEMKNKIYKFNIRKNQASISKTIHMLENMKKCFRIFYILCSF